VSHYTADQWTDYIRKNFPDAMPTELERWRNANNVFVDGLPPPTYSGPLSTGGFAGELPPVNRSQAPVYAQQGTPKVEDDEATAQGALPSNTAPRTLDDFYRMQDALTARLNTRLSTAATNRQKNYDEETEALKNRRFGPSRSEQLFALAAAIGKPTLGRSFGEIMGNITPALADIQKTNREAEQAKADAQQALRRKYLLEGDDADLADIDRLLKLQTSSAAVLKQPNPWSGATFQPGVGWVPRPDSGAAPVAIGKGVVPEGKYKGRPTTQYSDGSFTVKDAAGNIIHFDAKGNQTNG
jgi:hypothetical protein